jgi:hypothetical protein
MLKLTKLLVETGLYSKVEADLYTKRLSTQKQVTLLNNIKNNKNYFTSRKLDNCCIKCSY